MKKQYAILAFPRVGEYNFSALYLCQVRLLHKDRNFPKVYADYQTEKNEAFNRSGEYEGKFTQVGFMSIQKFVGKYAVCGARLIKDKKVYLSKFQGKLVDYPLQDKNVRTRLVTRTFNKYEKGLFKKGIKWFYRDRDTDLIFKAENDKEALKVFKEKAKTIMFGIVSTEMEDFEHRNGETLKLPKIVGKLNKLPIYRDKDEDPNQIGTIEEDSSWDPEKKEYTNPVIYGRYLDISTSRYYSSDEFSPANTMTKRAIIAVRLNLLNESASKRIYKLIMEKQPDLAGYYLENTFYGKPEGNYLLKDIKLPKDLRTGVQLYPVTMLTYGEGVERKYRRIKRNKFLYLHNNSIEVDLFGKPIKLSQTAIKYYDIKDFILDNHMFCVSLSREYYQPNLHVIDFIGKSTRVRYTLGEKKDKEISLMDYLLEQQKLLKLDKDGYWDFTYAR